MATPPHAKLEFFPQLSPRRWLHLLPVLLLAALIVALGYDVVRGLLMTLFLGVLHAWGLRRRPLIVLDDAGLRIPGMLPSDRNLAASDVTSWSWTGDGSGLVLHLRSRRARLVPVSPFSASDRSEIARGLTERGYPQIQEAGAELAAIQHDKDRRFQAIGLWFGMLLLIFAAVWVTRGR